MRLIFKTKRDKASNIDRDGAQLSQRQVREAVASARDRGLAATIAARVVHIGGTAFQSCRQRVDEPDSESQRMVSLKVRVK